mmetsp:Transcript_14897/g.23569  ORF Transcript_14897/g.23569 Transcript_14897/m.23569 type:complete len:289 (-) Transcript_14897:1595-2461(-)
MSCSARRAFTLLTISLEALSSSSLTEAGIFLTAISPLVRPATSGLSSTLRWSLIFSRISSGKFLLDNRGKTCFTNVIRMFDMLSDASLTRSGRKVDLKISGQTPESIMASAMKTNSCLSLYVLLSASCVTSFRISRHPPSLLSSWSLWIRNGTAAVEIRLTTATSSRRRNETRAETESLTDTTEKTLVKPGNCSAIRCRNLQFRCEFRTVCQTCERYFSLIFGWRTAKKYVNPWRTPSLTSFVASLRNFSNGPMRSLSVIDGPTICAISWREHANARRTGNLKSFESC